MSLIQAIKADQLLARKNRGSDDAAITSSLLTTLIGEAEMVGKNAGREVTDAEVVEVVKKFVKNLEFVLEKTHPNSVENAEARQEKMILQKYLPTQLSVDDMVAEISKVIVTRKAAGAQTAMSDLMQHFKVNFAGRYDGKQLSTTVKEELAR